MAETPKRLAPKGETLRELFLKSGNICAFPGCARLMMNAEGVFIGNLCHIEAAELGGERFNASMSNEERRSFANLMLMCYEHHQITNDVGQYTVGVLHKYKSEHESRFASPQRAITETLMDWTKSDEPVHAQNLRRMNRVLGWNLVDGDLKPLLDALRKAVEALRIIPVETRNFAGKIAERAERVKSGTHAVRSVASGFKISCRDVEMAFQLKPEEVNQYCEQLETYKLGYLDKMSVGDSEVDAILLKDLENLPLWRDLAHFAATEGIPMDTFASDLNFATLDE